MINTGIALRFSALFSLLALFNISASAQELQNEGSESQTILDHWGWTPKKKDAVHLNVLMKGSFNQYGSQGQYAGAGFGMDVLRVHLYGEINSWLSYSFRQRLNSNSIPQNSSNVGAATDYAYLKFKLPANFDFTFGKMWAMMGGWEPEGLPTDIYLYSNFMCNSEAFLTAANLGYTFLGQNINFQVANAHNQSFEKRYSGYNLENIGSLNNPLMYSFMWNGSLLSGLITTAWSYNLSTEAVNMISQQIATGTRFDFGKWGMDVDYYYAKEDLDTKMMISGVINNDVGEGEMKEVAQNVSYQTVSTRLDYEVHPKVNLIGKYVYEEGRHQDPIGEMTEDRYLQTHTYMLGMEYRLTKNGLRAYANYFCQRNNFATDLQQSCSMSNSKNATLALGLTYNLPVL